MKVDLDEAKKKNIFKIEKFFISFKSLKQNKSYKSDNDLEKFEENYLILLRQNEEKDKLIKSQDASLVLLNSNCNEKIKLLEEITLTNLNLSQENKKLTKVILETEERERSSKKEIDNLTAKINSLEIENSNYRLKISQQEEISKLQNEMNEINYNSKNRIITLENNLNKLKEICDDKENMIKDLVNKLNTIIEKADQDEQNYKNINIQLLETYKRQINELESEINDKTNQIKKLSDCNKSLKDDRLILINNINNLKESVVNVYEKMNLKFIEIDKMYSAKLTKMKIKITNIMKNTKLLYNRIINKKRTVKKYDLFPEKITNFQILKSSNKISNYDSSEQTNNKILIEKLKKDTTELKFRISNQDKLLEENKKEKSNMLVNKENNIVLKSKLDWLQKEYNKFLQITEPNYKDKLTKLEKIEEQYIQLVKTTKELENTLKQYKIENLGKSKIISELTEESEHLKNELSKLK